MRAQAGGPLSPPHSLCASLAHPSLSLLSLVPGEGASPIGVGGRPQDMPSLSPGHDAATTEQEAQIDAPAARVVQPPDAGSGARHGRGVPSARAPADGQRPVQPVPPADPAVRIDQCGCSRSPASFAQGRDTVGGDCRARRAGDVPLLPAAGQGRFLGLLDGLTWASWRCPPCPPFLPPPAAAPHPLPVPTAPGRSAGSR